MLSAALSAVLSAALTAPLSAALSGTGGAMAIAVFAMSGLIVKPSFQHAPRPARRRSPHRLQRLQRQQLQRGRRPVRLRQHPRPPQRLHRHARHQSQPPTGPVSAKAKLSETVAVNKRKMKTASAHQMPVARRAPASAKTCAEMLAF